MTETQLDVVLNFSILVNHMMAGVELLDSLAKSSELTKKDRDVLRRWAGECGDIAVSAGFIGGVVRGNWVERPKKRFRSNPKHRT